MEEEEEEVGETQSRLMKGCKKADAVLGAAEEEEEEDGGEPAPPPGEEALELSVAACCVSEAEALFLAALLAMGETLAVAAAAAVGALSGCEGGGPFKLWRPVPVPGTRPEGVGMCSTCAAAPNDSSLDRDRCNLVLLSSRTQSSCSCNLFAATFRRNVFSPSSFVFGDGAILTPSPLWAESRFHSSRVGRGDRRAGCFSVGGSSAGKVRMRDGGLTMTGPSPWIDVAAVPAVEDAAMDWPYE